MPAKEYPHKRPRTEAPNKGKKYTNAAEIRFALRADNQESLTEALSTLRSQLAIKSTEEKIAPQDERLELVKQWMQSSPGAHDLFSVWDNATLRQSSLISLVVSILSSVLTLLSAHYTDHALGQPIMKTLLVPSRLRQLNSYLGGSNNELVIVVLKLYNVMSNFAGGHDRKAVLEGFGWEIKSLPKLLNMRRKTHGENDTTDPLLRPDIRTLYVLLLLSFVDAGSSSQIKTAFLEQHREAFLAMFKGLVHDHYSLARKILEVCWAGIWSDAKVKRTLKVGLFNETTLGHLFKLYDRTQSDDDDEDHIPANLVHHFLLAICTRPGVGICFKDRGWYPREMEGDDLLPKEDDESARKGGKIYNKILANILKTLKVNEDSRQQELALKILSACPELVAGYWSAAALTLEPRLSSKWLANISVFGNIISLPVPSSMFYMPNSQLYQPTPPPLTTIMENILPSVGTKTNFSKGLQSPSGLVQHCTALALARCLVKYHSVCDQFHKVAMSLEENEEDGQWNKRCRELEREVRRRVPEFQVVIGFSQQKHTGPLNQVNSTKIALLAETAQRLLWLYHRCLPAVVAEARFDVGKLLLAFSQESHAESQSDLDENDESPNTASRLYRVQKLHILSLLKDSDQFVWTGKTALPYTPFRILLTSLISTPVPAIRAAIASLLQHILSNSILFQEDPNEPDLWIKALPKHRVALTEADATLFQGETEGLIAFLDDCVQRCLKTPYRYVEALHSDPNITGTNEHRLDMYPSPLLMTVMEQLDAKMNNKSLAPSHLLGVISFIRKILVNLASKTSDLRFLRAYARRLDETLLMERLSQASPTFFTSVRREVDILYASLSFASFAPPITTSSTSEMEASSKRLRTVAASQLVDWLRTLNQPLTPIDLRRLVGVVTSLDPSMLPSIVENLVPGQTDLWAAFYLASNFSEYRRSLTFTWLYIHSGLNEIINEECQIALINSLLMQNPALIDITRAVYLIIHRISAARQEEAALKSHLTLLARSITALKPILSSTDLNALKEIVFVQPRIKLLLGAAIEPSSKDDRKIVSGISDYWFNILKTGLDNQPPVSVDTACAWVKYLESDQLFDLLDFFEKDSRSTLKASALPPINVVLDALSNTSAFESQAEQALIQRLPQLLSLKSVLSDSHLLEQVIAIAIEASLPVSLDGHSPVSTSSPSGLITIIKRAESRWARRNQVVGVDIDIRPFLMQDALSDSTAKIISCLLYQQPSSHQALVDWLNPESLRKHDARYLVPILYAFVDSSTPGRMPTSSAKTDVWLPLMSKIVQVIADVNVPSALRRRAQDCLISILSASGTDAPKLLDAVAVEMKSASRSLSHELLSTGVKLSTGLIRASSIAKAHLVDTLLTVTIQHQFFNVDALYLAVSCLAAAQLKPLIVNRHLQSALQHVQFFKLCARSSTDNPRIREAIIELLHCLFKLHPHNTCQISHIEPLIRVYRGTLSRSDIQILSIFRLFEAQRKLSATALISRWSSASNTSTSILGSIVVLRTCLNFPRWRQLGDQSDRTIDSTEAALYDPVFLMLLFSQMLADQSPMSAFGWIELFRTNVVSLFIRALSSKEGEIRDLAMCQIVGLWKLMETADLQERPHVLYILNLLRDLLPAPSNNAAEYPSQLPTYTTLLLMHALRAVFNPSSFIYPLTARFLLQRPSLDTADVPMLYNLLYSSSDDHWKKERGWMIKFLADGMVGSEDWRALKRRHTWDLLASLFQSADGLDSTPLRMGILEVLAHLTCNAQATTSLILKSALLPWIEMQLSQPTSKSEGVEWIKILENILVIVDSKKVEASTNGEWRAVICRCLMSLLSAIENFPHAVPVVLRLALLNGTASRDLPSLLDLAVGRLEQLESTIELDLQSLSSSISDDSLVLLPSAPHRSLTLHQRLQKPTSASSQRKMLMSITEMLWRASMTLDWKSAAWEKLSPRLLLWRSVSPVQEIGPAIDTSPGEWARKEAVVNASQVTS
ncbi:ribosome 60S biogenesis N-terminal-domain-containing protein [Pholiota molesta]|nr:ribosome 60S biogenesis N-terminal-domain-containing protein [Pholiota molesta]